MPRSAQSDAYAATIDLLIRLRKEHGVSQVELASRLGTRQQFVSLVENRGRRLDIVEFVAFVRAIGADPAHVFTELLSVLPGEVRL